MYGQEGISITEELNYENLANLIEHWIEHNESHMQSFREWAQKAKKDGFVGASEDILEAANKIKESNEYLIKAKEGLFHLHK
ncbi:MAG: hypothetical protein ACPK85_15165 [Methanosarcina sp.]